MDDRRPDYRAEGQTIGAVGEGATAHFHQGFTAEDVLALLRALRLGGREALTRDGAGDVIVGQGDERVRISPSQAEALSQLPQDLPSDTPDQERHRLGALAQAIAGDLAPPVDFACLAREYAQRREEQGHPLAPVEAAESLYVPLGLRFYRALRPSEDDLYRREGRTYEDIRAAVEAPNPRSPQPRPFPALALLGDPGAGKSTSLRHLGLELMQEILEGEEPDVPILLFVSLGDHRQGRPVDFLAQEYGRWYGAKEFRKEFWEVLQAGRLWLLADGLNEMPCADEEDREARVRDWRRFFKHDFPPGNRALVACRVADYGVGLYLPRLWRSSPWTRNASRRSSPAAFRPGPSGASGCGRSSSTTGRPGAPSTASTAWFATPSGWSCWSTSTGTRRWSAFRPTGPPWCSVSSIAGWPTRPTGPAGRR
jgi:hypothetical protein